MLSTFNHAKTKYMVTSETTNPAKSGFHEVGKDAVEKEQPLTTEEESFVKETDQELAERTV